MLSQVKSQKGFGNSQAGKEAMSRSMMMSKLNNDGEEDSEPQQESILPGTEYDNTLYLRNFEKSTSRDFMDEVTYTVPLKGLFKVVKACSSNEGCAFQAVLLQIRDKRIRMMYNNASHLIQVWNKQGELVYQRGLDAKGTSFNKAVSNDTPLELDDFYSQLKKEEKEKQVHCWNIYQSHFVYMLDVNLADSQYIYVIDLSGAELSCSKPLREIRIAKPASMIDDPTYDKLGLFQSKYLFAAQQTGVRSINIDKLLEKEPTSQKDNISVYDVMEDSFKFRSFYEIPIKMIHPSDDNTCLRISKGSLLRDLLDLGDGKVAMAFETEENQLIFYEVQLDHELSQDQHRHLNFKELQHVIPRSGKWVSDPIIKCSNLVIWENREKRYLHSGICLRKSGCIDFYSDFRLVQETQNSIETSMKGLNAKRFLIDGKFNSKAGKFIDVASDFGCLYFRDMENIYKCPMSWKQECGLSVSAAVQIDKGRDAALTRNRAWKSITDNIVNQSAKIFSTFCLYFTKMIITHNNILSIYDIIHEEWEDHYVFDAPIKSIYRMVMDSKTRNYKLGIILKNDTIRTLYNVQDQVTKVMRCALLPNVINLPGTMYNSCQDTRTTTWKCMFILCDKKGKFNYNAQTQSQNVLQALPIPESALVTKVNNNFRTQTLLASQMKIEPEQPEEEQKVAVNSSQDLYDQQYQAPQVFRAAINAEDSHSADSGDELTQTEEDQLLEGGSEEGSNQSFNNAGSHKTPSHHSSNNNASLPGMKSQSINSAPESQPKSRSSIARDKSSNDLTTMEQAVKVREALISPTKSREDYRSVSDMLEEANKQDEIDFKGRRKSITNSGMVSDVMDLTKGLQIYESNAGIGQALGSPFNKERRYTQKKQMPDQDEDDAAEAEEAADQFDDKAQFDMKSAGKKSGKSKGSFVGSSRSKALLRKRTKQAAEELKNRLPWHNENEPEDAVQLYVIRQDKIWKVDAKPFPKCSTMAVEYTCADIPSKESCILYINAADHGKIVKYEFTPDYKQDVPSKLGIQVDNEEEGLMELELLNQDMQYPKAPPVKSNIKVTSKSRPIQAFLGQMTDDSDMDPTKLAIKKSRMPITEQKKYNRIMISNGDIYTYDEEYKLIDPAVTGRHIRSAVQIDKQFTYTISDKRFAWDNKNKTTSSEAQSMPAGLFIYDYERMLKTGNVEVYKVRDTIGGINNHIDFSLFMQRISIMTSLEEIQIVPLAHRSAINFFGIRPKDDYMIWHHTKPSGEFTAVDVEGVLTKWSVTTGKIIEKIASDDVLDVQEMFADKQSQKVLGIKKPKLQKCVINDVFDFKGYSIYKGSENDFSFRRGWQDRGDHSIQLLVHDEPVYKFFNTGVDNNENNSKTSTQMGKALLRKLDSKMKEEDIGQTFEYRNFILIELRDEKVTKLLDFQHVYYPGFADKDENGCVQRLYFDEGVDLMLERLKDSICNIYMRHDQPNSKTVQWRIWRRIKRFPSLLAGESSYNFLFSPNFKFYIDCDFEGDTYIVRDVVDNCSVRHVIPNGLISLSLKGSSKSKKALPRLAKLMSFEDNKHLRILNKGGVDCIYNFFTGQVRCAAAIDNFEVNMFNFKQYHHDPTIYEPSDTLGRLSYLMDSTKVLQNQLKKMAASLDLSKTDIFGILYGHLFSVDYTQDAYVQLYHGKPIPKDKDASPAFIAAQLSFTFLDMQIIEKVLNDREFDLSNIDEGMQIQQCFNIFPGMDTAFHKLAETKLTNFDSSSISLLFQVANSANLNPDLKKKYFLPLIENIIGKTPLDIVFRENKNVNLAYQFMRNIRSYHFLHSGPVINRIIPDAIKMGVPEINVFLDSRLVPSVHLQSGTLSKQAILEDLAEECQGFKYGLAIADAWEDKNSLCKKLFDPSEFKKPITIKYLDIPELHLNTKIGIEFWDAVSESDDLSLFDTKAIQILINYKWSIIKPKVFNRYLYPYLLFLLCFSTWSNFLYQKRTDEGYVAINYGLTIVLVLFSCYFMIGEIKQLYITGPSYFLDAWNFLDIVPLVLVTTTSSWASFDVLLAGNKDIYTETGEVYRDYLISFAALLMWFKFVYFMRCTENTGWLVRMLVEVMKELQSFLLIYAITIVAFADAFNSLSNSQVSELMTKPFELDKDGNNTTVPMNKEYAQTNGGFVDGWPSAFIYTYTLTLGEFGSSNESIVYPNQFVFGSSLCYLYFFICSLLNLIVMLNLLIAVISDTHSRVTDKQDQLRFQELSRIITDYLFLDDRTEVQLVKQIDQFLIIAMESDKKEKDEEDLGFIDVMTSLKQMKHEEQRAFEDCKLSLKDNQKKLDSFADKQADMMDDMNNSMEFDESDEEADY